MTREFDLRVHRRGFTGPTLKHGMLNLWFKPTYPLKHLTNWLYRPCAEYRVLNDAAGVLFKTQGEGQQAQPSFWLNKAREHVVAYGTAQPPQHSERLCEQILAAHPHLRGKRIVLFLTRIHEKKGCDLLVRAFARAAGAGPALHLVMASPDQIRLLPRIQAMAAAAGMADRVSWPAMLQGDMKWGAFYASEVFALPSHQENFGIAVAEALGCGLAVLISDKVNIWREIEADGAGIVTPDTAAGAEQGLRQWIVLPEQARADFRHRALASFHAHFTTQAMADSLLHVIEGAAGQRKARALA